MIEYGLWFLVSLAGGPQWVFFSLFDYEASGFCY